MNISSGLQAYTASIKSAMQMVMIQKSTHQDASSLKSIVKSMPSSNGVGGKFDMTV